MTKDSSFDLRAFLSKYDTSLILDTLAEDVELSAREMVQNKEVYDELTVRIQRNLAIRLRLLACEFCDIDD